MTQQMSGTNARFLNPKVVLSEIFRVMEPNLVATDLIPKIDSGGVPIVYGRKTSKAADGRKQTPRLVTPSSMFPEVQISRIVQQTALTSAEGLSIRFDKSALKLPSGRDMIMDGLSSIAFWMAEFYNGAIYAALDAGSTDDGIANLSDWGGVNATPVEDLRRFKNAMIRPGYPYRMTDMFVDGANFQELEGFLISHEIPEYRSAALNSPFTDQLVIPIEGRPVVHRMMAGMVHGDIMGIDARHPNVAAMYYHNDPAFGTPSTIKYETVVAGQTVTKTVQNFGVNTHTYFENDTHDTVLQVWADTVPVVKDPFGIITGDGL